MRYRFLTVMHGMRLATIKNRGTRIFNGARISNGKEILDETVNTKWFESHVGMHSADEFDDSTYIYIDGEFEDIHTKDEVDEFGTYFAFVCLRQTQQYCYRLWEVKDNFVYVRDGFLLVEDSEGGHITYKASLSAMFSRADLKKEITTFTNEELSLASQDFEPTSYKEYKDKVDAIFPTSEVFYKSKDSNRIYRAYYFTMRARTDIEFPLKISSYCNALECLFTIGNSEINHKMSSRVALMLGNTEVERIEIYRTVKKAYGIRSSISHGQHIKETDESLIGLSISLDQIMREFLKEEHEVFSMNDNDMEEFFIKLTFR